MALSGSEKLRVTESFSASSSSDDEQPLQPILTANYRLGGGRMLGRKLMVEEGEVAEELITYTPSIPIVVREPPTMTDESDCGPPNSAEQRSFGENLSEQIPFIDSNSRPGSVKASIGGLPMPKKSASQQSHDFELIESLPLPYTNTTTTNTFTGQRGRQKEGRGGKRNRHAADSGTNANAIANAIQRNGKSPEESGNSNLNVKGLGLNGRDREEDSESARKAKLQSLISLFQLKKSVFNFDNTPPPMTWRESMQDMRRRMVRKITKFELSDQVGRIKSRHLAKKEHRQIRKETKATKTLAIVLLVFLVCWVPFFTLHLSNSICMVINNKPCVEIVAFFFTTWVGYMNSFMNPIIYTIFNPEYRKAFRKLLTCSPHSY